MKDLLSSAPSTTRKAIALISGGLDSALAAKLILNQGIQVTGLHLLSPFGCREEVEKVAAGIGIPLMMREKGEAFIDLVENPRYGYGKNMNPCIDCRIFMFQIADQVRQEIGADFIVTGEVLGQRPMSQQRNALHLIDSKSVLGDRLVRPLSAHHFNPSLPEREGWVDRNALLKISGRGRKDQLALAELLKIPYFSSPSGGCLLTDANFSKRLRDFFDQPTHASSEERLAQAEMIRLGRHFRFSEVSKAIVARNNEENKKLRDLWPRAHGTFVAPVNFEGPVAVLYGQSDLANVELTAQIITRYGRAGEKPVYEFSVEEPTHDTPQSFSFKTRLEPQALEVYRL